MASNLHWTNSPDPNVTGASWRAPHINRPRMSADTIIKLFTLKAELEGRSVDVLREAQEFEENNM